MHIFWPSGDGGVGFFLFAMNLRTDLMIGHEFRAQPSPNEWVCQCGKPRALHLNDGFVATAKDKIQMNPKATYRGSPHWSRPRPWTVKEQDDFRRDSGQTRATASPA